MRRPFALLCLPVVLGGCFDIVWGLNASPTHLDAAYARAYNDAGTGATYTEVPQARLGMSAAIGPMLGSPEHYLAIRAYGAGQGAVRGKALDAQGTVVESFRLERSSVGVEAEAGKQRGLFGSVAVERQSAEGRVTGGSGPGAYDLRGSGRGYGVRLLGGYNHTGADRNGQGFGVVSLFGGVALPISSGDPVLPTTVATENGQRVMGPDPRRAGGLNVFAGIRLGLLTGSRSFN